MKPPFKSMTRIIIPVGEACEARPAGCPSAYPPAPLTEPPTSRSPTRPPARPSPRPSVRMPPLVRPSRRPPFCSPVRPLARAAVFPLGRMSSLPPAAVCPSAHPLAHLARPPGRFKISNFMYTQNIQRTKNHTSILQNFLNCDIDPGPWWIWWISFVFGGFGVDFVWNSCSLAHSAARPLVRPSIRPGPPVRASACSSAPPVRPSALPPTSVHVLPPVLPPVCPPRSSSHPLVRPPIRPCPPARASDRTPPVGPSVSPPVLLMHVSHASHASLPPMGKLLLTDPLHHMQHMHHGPRGQEGGRVHSAEWHATAVVSNPAEGGTLGTSLLNPPTLPSQFIKRDPPAR